MVFGSHLLKAYPNSGRRIKIVQYAHTVIFLNQNIWQLIGTYPACCETLPAAWLYKKEVIDRLVVVDSNV